MIKVTGLAIRNKGSKYKRGWSDTLYECKCRGLGVGLTLFSDLTSSRIEEKKEHQIVLIRAYNLVEGDRHLKSRIK